MCPAQTATPYINSELSTEIIRNAVFDTEKKKWKDKIFARWFDGFVYNQIWEDPEVDARALEIQEDSRILTISSGGCNLLNYLLHNPQEINAVDLNQNHLYLAHLKILALQYLPDYETFFRFFGKANSKDNVDNYFRYIQPHLTKDAQQYWEKKSRLRKPNIYFFANNVYRFGAMGKFIGFLHRFARNFSIDLGEFLTICDAKEREDFFDQKLGKFFKRRIVSFLGNLPVLFYNLGIPPKQFEYMKKECGGNLNDLYYERVKRLICSFPIEENYFAWQALSRSYDCENRRAVPDYLKEEHYETIKNRSQKIQLNLVSLNEFLLKKPEESLDKFVFLDSLDWMDKKQLTELWTEVARVGTRGAKVIFRTSSTYSPVEELLDIELLDKFIYHREKSQDFFLQDRSAIYGGFHLYERK